jgi:hypothetical protein
MNIRQSVRWMRAEAPVLYERLAALVGCPLPQEWEAGRTLPGVAAALEAHAAHCAACQRLVKGRCTGRDQPAVPVRPLSQLPHDIMSGQYLMDDRAAWEAVPPSPPCKPPSPVGHSPRDRPHGRSAT